MKANTVLTSSLVSVKELNASDREQTYSIISLPIDLTDGEYVDIRLLLPNGQDYIVLSKKQAEIPSVNGQYLTDSIRLTLSEGELLTMSSAIIDAAKINGASLYAIKYVQADAQEAAQETYVPSNEVLELIEEDPNSVDTATQELRSRWTNTARQNRNEHINQQVEQGNGEGATTTIDEDRQAKQEAREEYLSSLVAPIQ